MDGEAWWAAVCGVAQSRTRLKRLGSSRGSDGKVPTMRETWVCSLGWEDPLEKEMATRSSTPAWKIPWMGEPIVHGVTKSRT